MDIVRTEDMNSSLETLNLDFGTCNNLQLDKRMLKPMYSSLEPTAASPSFT